jgi:hypothetical protein
MKLKLIALMVAAGTSMFAQSAYYGEGRDLRGDYRDLANDRAQADRLRADIARDRFQLHQARERGDRWEANRISGDMARDQASLNALMRDMGRDRRDIHHDQWERDYR